MRCTPMSSGDSLIKNTFYRKAEAFSGRLSIETWHLICEYPAVQVTQHIQSNADPAIRHMVSCTHRKVRPYPRLYATAPTLTTLVQK